MHGRGFAARGPLLVRCQRPTYSPYNPHLTQVMPMPRKPNYDFERKERERLKSEKNAARAKAKEKPAKEGPDNAPPAPTKTEE